MLLKAYDLGGSYAFFAKNDFILGRYERIMDLKQFFEEHKKVAVAFSGGVDSSYLLYAAIKNNADVKAYYVKTAFQPEFEFEDAKKLAEGLGAKLDVICLDVLCNEDVKKNDPLRCYHCKNVIFGNIIKKAKEEGYTDLLDGTNASDDASDRPGMRALKELNVYSPLRICGLTKSQIRNLSREAGLFTWDKPAYACLATRIPTGTAISEDILNNTERAEDLLFSLGFTDFRVRYFNGAAKVQLKREQFEMFIAKKEEITTELKKYYSAVLLDMEER